MGHFIAGMSGVQIPVPSMPPITQDQIKDARLGAAAEQAGEMLEDAYRAGDRELALIFQRAMFDVVKLRQARRFGTDTQHNKG